jgi:uncharacterized protein
MLPALTYDSLRSLMTAIVCANAIVLFFVIGCWLGRWLRRMSPPPAAAEPVAPRLLGRRALLEAAGVAVPITTFAAAGSGITLARAAPAAPTRRVSFDRLPRGLDGMRILQLSDMHLGAGRQVDELEALLASLESDERRPDLIVLTGDIAENVDLLAPALRLVAALKPRLGAYSALGNHEHLNGITRARAVYERSDVPLLVDAGHALRINEESRLYIAGIDDPVIVHVDVRPRLRVPIERALRDAPEGAFRLLL